MSQITNDERAQRGRALTRQHRRQIRELQRVLAGARRAYSDCWEQAKIWRDQRDEYAKAEKAALAERNEARAENARLTVDMERVRRELIAFADDLAAERTVELRAENTRLRADRQALLKAIADEAIEHRRREKETEWEERYAHSQIAQVLEDLHAFHASQSSTEESNNG